MLPDVVCSEAVEGTVFGLKWLGREDLSGDRLKLEPLSLPCIASGLVTQTYVNMGDAVGECTLFGLVIALHKYEGS